MDKRVIIDEFLNELHAMQMQFIDEAVDSLKEFKEANEVIAYIKSKL